MPHQPLQPRSNAYGWQAFLTSVVLFSAAVLILFTFWASKFLPRWQRRKARTEGIELGAMPEAGGRTDDTAAEGRDEEHVPRVSDRDGYAEGRVTEKDIALPASLPRVYLRKVDERLDGLVPVEGVEMV